MTLSAKLPTQAPTAVVLVLAAVLGVVAGIDPKMAVVAAIGLAFVALVLTDLTLGLCLFTVVAFIDLLPAFGSAVFSFAKLTGALLTASWAATSVARNRRKNGFASDHPFAAYALALFLAWAAVSLIWAEQVGQGTTPLLRYALNLVLFMIVYAAVTERRHVAWVVGAYVMGASAAALYGIFSPPAATVEDELARATGTVGDANELAAVLVPGLVLALVIAVAPKRAVLVRVLAVAGAVFCALAIYFTLSRGGLIALGAALVASLFLGGRWRPLFAAAAIAIALFTVGYFVLIATPSERVRVTTIHGGTGRSDIWTVGWRMVQAHPVTGVGVGNFKTSSVHYLLKPGAIKRDEFIVDTPKVAHNTYLQVLAELGIPGLVLFMFIIVFSLSSGWRAARIFDRRGDLRMELLARGILVALVGLLAADVFISEEFSKQLWLLLGLCPALLAIANGKSGGELPPPVRTYPGRRVRWSQAPALDAVPKVRV